MFRFIISLDQFRLYIYDSRVNAITVRSCAKINLGLRVKEKRPDGYHNIETIFVPIKLFDKIRLEIIDHGIILKINFDENAFSFWEMPSFNSSIIGKIKIPSGKNNLAYKAASLFFKKSGITKGIAILLNKSIPVGAGLGGGSSNAAAVLAGMNRLFNNPLTKKELFNLGLELGMDVPFFLTAKPCYATGRGEILTPIAIPKLYVCVYFPNYPIRTEWAYQQLAKTRSVLTNTDLSLMILKKKLVNGDLVGLSHYLRNSFEEIVFAVHPDLAKIKKLFLSSGAYAASLTGSGSAIFALVEKKKIPQLKTALKRNKIRVIFTESW